MGRLREHWKRWSCQGLNWRVKWKMGWYKGWYWWAIRELHQPNVQELQSNTIPKPSWPPQIGLCYESGQGPRSSLWGWLVWSEKLPASNLGMGCPFPPMPLARHQLTVINIASSPTSECPRKAIIHWFLFSFMMPACIWYCTTLKGCQFLLQRILTYNGTGEAPG